VFWKEKKSNKKKIAESEIKYFVRSPDKSNENAIFRKIDEDTSIHRERYNAGNHGKQGKKKSSVCGEWKISEV
jgi:hypothetical protein